MSNCVRNVQIVGCPPNHMVNRSSHQVVPGRRITWCRIDHISGPSFLSFWCLFFFHHITPYSFRRCRGAVAYATTMPILPSTLSNIIPCGRHNTPPTNQFTPPWWRSWKPLCISPCLLGFILLAQSRLHHFIYNTAVTMHCRNQSLVLSVARWLMQCASCYFIFQQSYWIGLFSGMSN